VTVFRLILKQKTELIVFLLNKPLEPFLQHIVIKILNVPLRDLGKIVDPVIENHRIGTIGEKDIEYFDKNKLLVGLLKACQKRPVDSAKIADEIEQELQNSLRLEIPSTELGEMVMEKLKNIDAVAYVRFASVYREFKDVETFLSELQHFLKKP
jgi:transcriptional regulator NrdR